MSSVSPSVPAPARSMSAVPRSVWIGGGLLCAVTAGLASALVMRTAPEPVAALATSILWFVVPSLPPSPLPVCGLG